MDRLKLSSPSLVQHHVQQLEKRGFLRRNPSNPHDYTVLSDSPDKQIAYINLYGLAHCGPSGLLLDGNPVDRIPISTRILGFPSDEAFMVKAKGDSMSPRINDGDIIVSRKSSKADSGDVVVCVKDGEVLIKKFQMEKNQIILTSLNSTYPTLFVGKGFCVVGLVKVVLSFSK